MTRALVCKIKPKGTTVEVKLSGSIDENSAHPLADLAARPELEFDFDFSGVDFVNSSGIREWMRFLKFASQAARKITIAGARPNFVVAMLNLPALRDGVKVHSIYRSFACPQKHRTEVLADAATLKSGVRTDTVTCTKCGDSALADDEDEDYDQLSA